MTARVAVKAELLEWAAGRAGGDVGELSGRFPKLEKWLSGEVKPTLKQLEGFARATYTPVGYFFLESPPIETLPIPDLRTMRGDQLRRPSPNLLDVLHSCEQRQEWFRDFALSAGEDPLPFVGSARLSHDVVRTATKMRRALRFDLEGRASLPSWTEALRQFIDQADELGVLVMRSGIVGSNTRRKLDPEEFRGFALADELAPLVFINGADTKAAQMFTLAHELAHIWLGQTALSDVSPVTETRERTEQWCNEVAAELLVPLDALRAEHRRADPHDEMNRLARHFKVSTLVVLRRMHEAGFMSRQAMWAAYRQELIRLQQVRPPSGGGDFYRTQFARVGKRFARALVVSTLEGQTLYREAFRLMGFSKLATFRELGYQLGVQ